MDDSSQKRPGTYFAWGVIAGCFLTVLLIRMGLRYKLLNHDTDGVFVLEIVVILFVMVIVNYLADGRLKLRKRDRLKQDLSTQLRGKVNQSIARAGHESGQHVQLHSDLLQDTDLSEAVLQDTDLVGGATHQGAVSEKVPGKVRSWEKPPDKARSWEKPSSKTRSWEKPH